MSREVRLFSEGALRWVQASGTGGWATASAALTALIGFVQAGMGYTSAINPVMVMERGSAHHWKIPEAGTVEVQFTYLQVATANKPNPATASAASVPEVHLEIKHTDTEAGSPSQYFQFMNCVKVSDGWSEGPNGNQWQETWRAFTMNGPTASGYIA